MQTGQAGQFGGGMAYIGFTMMGSGWDIFSERTSFLDGAEDGNIIGLSRGWQET